MDGSFLGGFAAVAMLLFFLLCGYVGACSLLVRERWLIRLWIGLAFGLLQMMWLPALFSFLLGFTIAAHVLALIAAFVFALALYLWRRPSLRATTPKGLPTLLLCVLPMTALSLYLLIHHTLRPVGGALHTGQSGFGDMSMHLGFITSLARQRIFPPEYSILPGVKLGYPFLCDSVSSSLYLLGAPLRLSYILPAAAAMALCFLGYYLLMLQWLSSRRKAALAFWLFFAGGGFGFAYFFDLLKADPSNITRIFTEFYQTPTNWTQVNLRWVNPVADLMLPQRATLFGWAMLLPCLYFLYRIVFQKGRNAVLLGLFAGSMPMIHTHSFLALGMVSAGLLICSLFQERSARRVARMFAPYALTALLLALPQLMIWTFRQAADGDFLKPHLNWVNADDNAIWFYLKNIGLVFLCLLPAVLGSPRRRRALWLCALPLWLLAEFVLFQPNEYDNNKLLFVVHMLSCGLVAAWLVDFYRKLKGLGGRRLVAAMTIAAGTLSGALTLCREVISDYELFSAEQVAAARYIDRELPTDALILTSDQHNNAPAALAGRNIVIGSGSYLYFHGVYDTRRNQERHLMLTDPEIYAQLAREYGVTHVYISSYERREGASESNFQDFPLLYESMDVSIYRTNQPDDK